jgi:soluble cytochrome b562
MDENKLIKLLEEKFPTKGEFNGLKQDVIELKTDVGTLKQDVNELRNDVGTLKQEFKEFKHEFRILYKTVVDGFKEVSDNIEELKSSAKTLDKILEASPIERINRLEKHAGLPVFVATVSEE